MHIRIEPGTVASTLMSVAIVLVLAHVAGAISSYVFDHERVFGLVDTFDMNVENNVPTFFSAFILVTSAVLLAVIASHASTDRHASHWRWLAIIFAVMAVDEDAALHELLIGPMHDVLPVSGPLYFAWVIPYGLAVLVVGLVYLSFVWSLPVRTRALFIGAGSLYLGGVLGFEFVGGWYYSLHGEVEDLPYSLLVAAEEFFEMSGIILFIYALLDCLRDRLAGEPLRISVSRS